ncbi:MAG: hypothetical protein QOH35_3615, partial [Acidobacteriaceae bacterium]|nr:hypothetical protein [Acidobacteriaceae bacterium]
QLISLLERCDRDIVRISLFRVRHGTHWRTFSAQRLPGRAAVWQTNTILIKTLGPNDGSSAIIIRAEDDDKGWGCSARGALARSGENAVARICGGLEVCVNLFAAHQTAFMQSVAIPADVALIQCGEDLFA